VQVVIRVLREPVAEDQKHLLTVGEVEVNSAVIVRVGSHYRFARKEVVGYASAEQPTRSVLANVETGSRDHVVNEFGLLLWK
jgi:hypothetical protein